jgi:hypothetical protein
MFCWCSSYPLATCVVCWAVGECSCFRYTVTCNLVSGNVKGACSPCLLLSPVPTSAHFHRALGLDTQTLAYMLDSLVRVSTRSRTLQSTVRTLVIPNIHRVAPSLLSNTNPSLSLTRCSIALAPWPSFPLTYCSSHSLASLSLAYYTCSVS